MQLQKASASQKRLARALQEIEARLEDHDERIEAVFEGIRRLMAPPEKPRRKIGFEVKDKAANYGKRK